MFMIFSTQKVFCIGTFILFVTILNFTFVGGTVVFYLPPSNEETSIHSSWLP